MNDGYVREEERRDLTQMLSTSLSNDRGRTKLELANYGLRLFLGLKTWKQVGFTPVPRL